jgi:hypothetical protein
MHTVFVIAIGLVLLGLCAFAGHTLGGTSGIAAAALVFLPLWFIAAGINLRIGVKKAGYSMAEEAPIFLVVFVTPGALALLAWLKYR